MFYIRVGGGYFSCNSSTSTVRYRSQATKFPTIQEALRLRDTLEKEGYRATVCQTRGHRPCRRSGIDVFPDEEEEF